MNAGRWLLLACAAGLTTPASLAEQTQAQGGSGQRTTTARLNFELSIGRLIFLRVGAGGAQSGTDTGAGSPASPSISRVDFSLAPMAIPGAALAPGPGNSRSVNWSGAAPSYATSNTVTLPVEVRSNAGQVRLTAQTTGPLSSGTRQIPMSQISVASNNPALPAPAIPASGTSASVNVSPGGSGTTAAPTLLTYRSADWTFSYAPIANPVAGTYSGRILFTAAAP